LGIPNVLRGELDLSDLAWADLSETETDKYRLREGDVLVVRTNGNPAYVGRCLAVPALEQTTVFASYLIRLTPDASRVRARFLVAMLNSPPVRRILRRHVRSSAGNYNVNTGGLRATPIPLPPLRAQDLVLSRLAALRAAADVIAARIAALEELRGQVFSGGGG
jgi:restriction endonuclease S subunit